MNEINKDLKTWCESFGHNVSDIQLEILEGIVERHMRKVLDKVRGSMPQEQDIQVVASGLDEDTLQSYTTGYKLAWQEAMEVVDDYRFGIKS